MGIENCFYQVSHPRQLLIRSRDLQLVPGVKGGAAQDVILAVIAVIKPVARPEDVIAARIHSGLKSRVGVMERIEALARMEAV